jgi:hypothetical protein
LVLFGGDAGDYTTGGTIDLEGGISGGSGGRVLILSGGSGGIVLDPSVAARRLERSRSVRLTS